MSKSAFNMCEGPFLKKTILYTLPIILSGILQLTFNAADLIIVGQFSENGSTAVAAVGATSSLIHLIVNLFIGLSVGAGVSVAQGIGARHNEDVHRTVHTAIPTAIISGLILTVAGILLSEKMLILMDTPQDVLPFSTLYMNIYFAGILFMMVYNFGASILRAAGDTKGPLLYLSCAGFINIILNAFFVIILHMDVAGVALATTISQAVSAILVIFALMRRTDACKLCWSKLKLYKKPLLKIIRIGLPSGIQGSLFSISNVLIQSSINSFGSIVLSGNTAAGSLEGFIYTAMNSFQQTSINFVGQNIGARRYDNVKKIVYINLACVSVLGIALSLSIYLLGQPLLSLYISNSPQAIEVGMIRLTFIAIPYFLAGIMDTMTGALRGMGSSIAPMFITVLGVCGFRVAWIYSVFRLFPMLECIYISYPISWVVTFVAEFITFCIVIKRMKRKSENPTLVI